LNLKKLMSKVLMIWSCIESGFTKAY
jgi:hypothetical protein